MKHIRLFESYNNGKLLCYHSTGTKSDNWKDIFITGYKIGGGANSGPGLYTFYNLDELNNNLDWSKVPVIIEFEVENYDGFYVEVPEIAMKMFGEYNVKNQIDNIMGKEWGINYPDLMKRIINNPVFPLNTINSTKFKREDSEDVKMSKWAYGKEFKGIIFDNPEGIFCVIYDTSLTSPKRFSVDGGNTWNTKEDLNKF